MTLLRDRPEERAARPFDRLAAHLTGDLVLPDSAAYDDARRVRNLRADRRPAVIVRAREVADVVRVVSFAREQGYPLTVRSGGHSFSGHGVADGGITLDLAGLNDIIINAETGVARLGPGVTSGDLAALAHEHGLALTTGDTASVAIGGLTVGGGIGWMVRKYGLTIDHLRSAEMVTADGQLVVASADENPDLFWAVRGGGGNFGIVTSLEFRLDREGTVYGGMLALPPIPEVIRGYIDYAIDAPEGLTTIAAVTHAPPAPFIPEEEHGKLIFAVFVVFAGEMEEGEKAVAPMRALAPPIADVIAPMPYPAIYDFTAEAVHPSRFVVRSMFADELSDRFIDAIIEHGSLADSVMNMIQIRPLGGAMARVPSDATAFAHRERRFLVAVINEWLDPVEDERQRAWVEEAWSAVNGHANGVYVNFLGEDGDGRIHEAYPARTLERLAGLKRKYDPDNLFRFNQNIRPSP